jgi:hypothetical protein
MEPKLNPKLKRILSNPELGNQLTKKIIDNNNKIAVVSVILEDLGIELELIPIGYTGEKSNIEKSKK